MTWSLAIVNGDLSFAGPGGYATVSGQNKLLQDLRNWLLEPRGTDPVHPDFGSTLDGGMLPDGTFVDPVIGDLITSENLVNIQSEVRRVLAGLQQQQLDRMTAEAALYGGKNTFAAGEILSSVDDVVVTQVFDTVFVQCIITTADGDQLSFTQALNS